jgi:FkbM family methyltransferase
MNIDGDSNAVDYLNKKRKRDINLHAYIAIDNKVKTFVKFDESALNTFSKSLVKEYKNLGYKVTSLQKVKTTSLKKILDKHLPKKSPIDFMSVDVEGLELVVLKSNDWKKYRPKLIIVEILDSYSLKSVTNSSITKFLAKKGYTLSMKTITNCFYVAK